MASVLTVLLFFSFFCTSINGHSPNPSNAACSSFECDDGVAVSYPFWHQDHHHQQQFEYYCGYPGFGISCNNDRNSATLDLFGDVYYVKNINYSENTLTLIYPEVKGHQTSCPSPRHNVTLDSSSFLHSSLDDDKLLQLFYNCSLFPPSPPSIECLRYGDKLSYAFKVGEIPEFDWVRYCEWIVTVPIVSDDVDLGGALQEGFTLTWRLDTTSSDCEQCEATGGHCGYSDGVHRNFVCFCSDGRRHPGNCHGNGVVSYPVGPNFVAMGALVFGGLITTGTILYLIQRRKRKPPSSHNPIFTLLPTFHQK